MDLDNIATNIATVAHAPIANGEPAASEKGIAAEPVLENSATEDVQINELDGSNIALQTATTSTIEDGEQGVLEEKITVEKSAAPTTTEDTPMSNSDPVDATESPPLTHALEALLGGLDKPSKPMDEAAPSIALESVQNSTAVPEIHPTPVNSVLALASDADPQALLIDKSKPTSLPVTTAENSAAGSNSTQETAQSQQTGAEPVPAEAEPREWETDSSPLDASSDDSSSEDNSDEESEDGENAYKLLSPEEQARILMEGDGGSDDEGGNKTKGGGAQLRTKNEIPEVVIPKPDVVITEEMPIKELGAVEAIVENILLIKGKTTGEYQVLESGSVLCLADKSVIGAVSEPLGRVQQPLYSVLFTNAGEITAAKLEVGTKVFYSERHSTYVFTQALKAYKGSDASNLHDEEVGDDEMEFSDDEAELEHKRRVKQAKRGRGGKTQQNGIQGRGGHHLQQQHTPSDANKGLNYDEAEDGPYKPLSRPVGYAQTVGRSEAPEEGSYQGGANGNTYNQNRDNFRGRGRGDRGDRGRGRGDRGRGDRGRGRGGSQDRRRDSSGRSLPPQGRPNYSQPPNSNPGQNFTPPFQSQAPGFPHTMAPNGYNNSAYSPHQPQFPAWPQFPPQPPQQQFEHPFPNMPMMPNMPNMWPKMPNTAPQAPPPGGAFINPLFFNNPQGGPPNQWNPPGPPQQ